MIKYVNIYNVVFSPVSIGPQSFVRCYFAVSLRNEARSGVRQRCVLHL